MSVPRPDDEEPAPPLGRRARKALATRNAMFGAGLSAFENRPLNLVSVLDITEATDVAKGVFYLHFGGKDEYLAALWEHVELGFLDTLRQRLVPCRSRRARLESTVGHYHDRLEESPRECRFWLRMASYFGDEIGQPGHMSRLRQEHLERLAALIEGVTQDDLDEDRRRVASIVDATSWGLISQALQLGGPTLGREAFVRAVTSAIRAAGRG